MDQEQFENECPQSSTKLDNTRDETVPDETVPDKTVPNKTFPDETATSFQSILRAEQNLTPNGKHYFARKTQIGKL